MPSRRLINWAPAWPAETVLDVAMTVQRLIAAAVRSGKPSARFRSGTRKTPPPRPSIEPIDPASAPDPKMIKTSDSVTEGIPDGDYLSPTADQID